MFKPGWEYVEMRRRRAIRRSNYTSQLKHVASRLAQRRRTQRTTKFSLNQAALMLRKQVTMMDRRDKELWSAYSIYYQQGLMSSLMKLKQTDHTVDLLSARIARTRRHNVWMAAVRMGDRVRVSLDRYEKWVHPDEINSQLKAYLAIMTRRQTVTTAMWIQIQAKDKLQEKLRKMFWNY